MVFTLEDPRRGLGPSDSVIRTISSRIAGGGVREVNAEPPRVCRSRALLALRS